jgi:hypothetical protein
LDRDAEVRAPCRVDLRDVRRSNRFEHAEAVIGAPSCANMLGDALRDYFDPKLCGGLQLGT